MGVGVEKRGELIVGPGQTGLPETKGTRPSWQGAARQWRRGTAAPGTGPGGAKGQGSTPATCSRAPRPLPTNSQLPRAMARPPARPRGASSAPGSCLRILSPSRSSFLPPLTFLLI